MIDIYVLIHVNYSKMLFERELCERRERDRDTQTKLETKAKKERE